jgi:hypothetical protein
MSQLQFIFDNENAHRATATIDTSVAYGCLRAAATEEFLNFSSELLPALAIAILLLRKILLVHENRISISVNVINKELLIWNSIRAAWSPQ